MEYISRFLKNSNTLLKNRSDMLIAIGVILIILMMIIPLPTVLLDLFMTLNLLFSILIILNVLYIRSTLEFSIFPSILLVSTIFSLALNISSTRLILTQGENFGGTIVRAFGSFVVGTSGSEGLVIGLIIFIIIIVVQYLVITKGASRVAEVSARFTLDSMPGKQMSLEAQFNSGVISEEELLQKKQELQQEADFFGSMDGASKFVSGNIIAGIFITFINIIGGMVVGTLIRNENIGSALNNYVQLTIGDGLVSQLPALLISTAAGIIVTRANSKGNIGEDFAIELTNYLKIYYLAGGLLCLLAFLPGFPWYLLLPLGVFLIVTARMYNVKKIKSQEAEKEEYEKEIKSKQVEVTKIEPLDPVSLEIGYDLVPLVKDEEGNADLLNRISSIRREIGINYGIIVPLIRIVDNYILDSSSYSIKMNGVEIGKGNIRINKLLAIHGQNTEGEELEGEKTIDPTFGLLSTWINISERAKAERSGFTVADPTSVISTHISTVLQQHASELLTRQKVSDMIEDFRKTNPVLIEELKKNVEISIVQRIFKKLLLERVSLRNLSVIFEVISDYGALTKEIDFLVEKVRQGLSRQISEQYADEHKTLYAYTLDVIIEKTLIDLHNRNQASHLMLSPDLSEKILLAIQDTVKPVSETKTNEFGDEEKIVKQIVILTSEIARPVISELLSKNINKLNYAVPILSLLEISEDCKIENVGVIKTEIEISDEEH